MSWSISTQRSLLYMSCTNAQLGRLDLALVVERRECAPQPLALSLLRFSLESSPKRQMLATNCQWPWPRSDKQLVPHRLRASEVALDYRCTRSRLLCVLLRLLLALFTLTLFSSATLQCAKRALDLGGGPPEALLPERAVAHVDDAQSPRDDLSELHQELRFVFYLSACCIRAEDEREREKVSLV